MGYINKKNKVGAVAENAAPYLQEGELGIDLNAANGDVGRVYVGTGSQNVAIAKKSEVDYLNESTTRRTSSPTGASVIPSGTTAERPSSPESGYLRFNTGLNVAEMWNGVTWGPVGGQLLGTSIIKGVQYMASVSAPNETITVTSGLNAFSVDSFTLADGASIVVEDNAVYKVL